MARVPTGCSTASRQNRENVLLTGPDRDRQQTLARVLNAASGVPDRPVVTVVRALP